MANNKIYKSLPKPIRVVIDTLNREKIPYFLTGSRCWGVHTPDSDFDICIMFKHYEHVSQQISIAMDPLINPNVQPTTNAKDSALTLRDAIIGISEKVSFNNSTHITLDFVKSNYGAGVKVNLLGNMLNLVRLTPGDFLFWLYATCSMNVISEINPAHIANKTMRHSMFENMRAIAKNTITYDGWKYEDNKLLILLRELNVIVEP